ncbi:hypothetical protein M2137_001877 [Parabacteroides sp. PFB2-10]|nr:hypothetical protein [Parabacteroides sp. PFB2-10]
MVYSFDNKFMSSIINILMLVISTNLLRERDSLTNLKITRG